MFTFEESDIRIQMKIKQKLYVLIFLTKTKMIQLMNMKTSISREVDMRLLSHDKIAKLIS